MEEVKSKAETIDIHNLNVEELYKKYNSSPNGLSAEQAKVNLSKYGPPSNAKDLPEYTTVKRDGEIQQILSEDLALGDLIYVNLSRSPSQIRTSSYLVADVIITSIYEPMWIESSFLYPDHAESNFLKQLSETKTDDNAMLTANLAFARTFVFSGSGFGLVFATGENCLLNDVDREVLRPEEDEVIDQETSGHTLTTFFKRVWSFIKGEAEEDRIEEQTFNYHTLPVEDILTQFTSDTAKGLTSEQVEKNQAESGKNVYRDQFRTHAFTQCIRDGQLQAILTKNLTQGDIIKMRAPQIVPADVRIIELAPDTNVDKSRVTGDSQHILLELESSEPNPFEATNIAFAMVELVEGSCTAIVVNVGRKTVTEQLTPSPIEF